MKSIKFNNSFIFAIISAGFLVSLAIFLLGKTSEKRQLSDQISKRIIKKFDIQSFINQKKDSILDSQKQFLSTKEDALSKTELPAEKIPTLLALAKYWNDSLKNQEIYSFYTSEAAKLDNSEKNLTFAAQLFLELLKNEHNESVLEWEVTEAISLFEKAIALNPSNDDLKIGLASCYIFGKGRNGDPQETMKGISGLLEVVRRDSTNMKAQFVLGIGGLVSGQFDKAVYRFSKVVEQDPNNAEAIAFLADAYAAQGKKEQAIYWYNITKKLVNNPAYSKEVDKRIKELN